MIIDTKQFECLRGCTKISPSLKIQIEEMRRVLDYIVKPVEIAAKFGNASEILDK